LEKRGESNLEAKTRLERSTFFKWCLSIEKFKKLICKEIGGRISQNFSSLIHNCKIRTGDSPTIDINSVLTKGQKPKTSNQSLKRKITRITITGVTWHLRARLSGITCYRNKYVEC
jgi:hypothetical protein